MREGYQLEAGRESTIPHQPQRAAGRRGRSRRVPTVRDHRALAGPRAPRPPPGVPPAQPGGAGAAADGVGRDGTGRDRARQRGPVSVRGHGKQRGGDGGRRGAAGERGAETRGWERKSAIWLGADGWLGG